MKHTGIVLFALVAALSLTGPALVGCASDPGMNPAPTDAKGKEAVALVAAASKKLATITSQETAGKTAAATKGWNTLRNIYPPSDNTYMVMLCNDYKTYAYAVRGYIAGTSTLQSVQDAAGTVNTDLLAMQ